MALHKWCSHCLKHPPAESQASETNEEFRSLAERESPSVFPLVQFHVAEKFCCLRCCLVSDCFRNRADNGKLTSWGGCEETMK